MCLLHDNHRNYFFKDWRYPKPQCVPNGKHIARHL